MAPGKGHTGAGPAKLILRAPPHLPFVQGWPGIMLGGNRQSATVQGTVEVRITNTTGTVKAKWLRVEVRKHESVATGSGVGVGGMGKSGTQTSLETIGRTHFLWRAPDGKDWDAIKPGDYRFVIPLQADMPPTADLPRGGGVRYELVASMCCKDKTRFFKKDSSTTVTMNEPLRIVKYELASSWPVHNQPEQRSAAGAGGQVQFIVERAGSACGPGDTVPIQATIRSMAPQPFRVKGFEAELIETTTIFPPTPDPNSKTAKKKNKPPPPPTVKRVSIAAARGSLGPQGTGENVGRGGEKSARLGIAVPKDRNVLTVTGAREFKVEYEIAVQAVCEDPVGTVGIPAMPLIIGSFTASSAQQAVKDIGYVPGLCPPPGANTPNGAQTPTHGPPGAPGSAPGTPRQLYDGRNSPPVGLPPSQSFTGRVASEPQRTAQPGQPGQPGQPQSGSGFVPRNQGHLTRRSSSGTTATTTTTNTDFAPSPAVGPGPQTVPGRSLAFPTPTPIAAAFATTNGPNRTRSPDALVPLSDRGGTRRTPQPQHEGLDRTSQYTNTTQGTFGPSMASTYERLVEEEYTPSSGSGSPDTATAPASSLARTPRAQDAQLPAQAPSQPPQWESAANEKQRLYNEARARAAATQEAEGRSLAEIGMVGVAAAGVAGVTAAAAGGSAPPPPTGAPPEYAPSSAPSDGSKPASIASSRPGLPAQYLTAAQEKELQRKRFNEAQRAVSGGGPPDADAATSGSGAASFVTANGPSTTASAATSPNLGSLPNGRFSTPTQDREQTPTKLANAVNAAPPGAPNDAPISYDELYGPAPGGASASTPSRSAPAPAQSSSSGLPQVPKAYLSAAEEKEMMKKRYEEATRRVARTQGIESPPPASSNGHSQQSQSQSQPQSRAQTQTPTGPGSPQAPSTASFASATGSGSANHAASGSHAVPPGAAPVPAPAAPKAYMSAVEEKEMMRRRYEQAQARVRGQSEPASPEAPPYDLPGVSGNAAVRATSPPAANNVANNVSNAARAASPPSSPPTGSRGAEPPYLSAAEEKEMMRRRYEEATTRVARRTVSNPASDGGSASATPAAVASPTAATFAASAPHASPPAASGSAQPAAQAPYPSAAEEKEMMRRRYEQAQSAVARTQPPPGSPTQAVSQITQASHPPSSAGQALAATAPRSASQRYSQPPQLPPLGSFGSFDRLDDDSSDSKLASNLFANSKLGMGYADTPPPGPPPVSAPISAPAASAPKAYMSAAEEKEMMRKRYEEAQGRVARVASGGFDTAAGSGSGSTPAVDGGRAVDAGPAPAPAPTSGPTSTPAYPSAAEEKEMMRKRFEDAQSRVAAAQSPPRVASPHTPARAASPDSQARNMSSSSTSPPYYATPTSSPPSQGQQAYRRDSTMSTMSRRSTRMSTLAPLPEGPPPPLPSRPPREYIELHKS